MYIGYSPASVAEEVLAWVELLSWADEAFGGESVRIGVRVRISIVPPTSDSRE